MSIQATLKVTNHDNRVDDEHLHEQGVDRLLIKLAL